MGLVFNTVPSKSKVYYIINSHSGVAHKSVGGMTPRSCHVDQIHREQKALTLDRVFYRRLCGRCFPVGPSAAALSDFSEVGSKT